MAEDRKRFYEMLIKNQIFIKVTRKSLCTDTLFIEGKKFQKIFWENLSNTNRNV